MKNLESLQLTELDAREIYTIVGGRGKWCERIADAVVGYIVDNVLDATIDALGEYSGGYGGYMDSHGKL
ncbi:MAG: hypothetical protein KKC03_02745 [Bacteroidetes bacterium]|nr:hypothetical protein [Bacteroidota bacterium]